jgi:hypothetical protein
MPLDHPELLGTEGKGHCSTLYCVYCYKDGVFTHPDMTLEDMQDHVREQLLLQGASADTIRQAVDNVRYLIRWLVTPESKLHRTKLFDTHA